MQEIITLTQDLIRFPTTADRPDAIMDCAEFVAGWLDRQKLPFQKIIHNGKPSIMALPQAGCAPLLLMSHLDVVDAPPHLFEPVVRDGKLYGRGSIDDKYAAALSLVLLKAHVEDCRQKGIQPILGVLITTDEETGGHDGAATALASLKSDFCIALDGGQVSKVVIKEKGILRVILTARGRTAHGARPWLGENAIENLVADVACLKPLFPATHPEYWHKTMNWSMVQAGKAPNQVPDHAEALFDIRYTETDDIDELVSQMSAAVKGTIEVESVEPVFSGLPSPWLDKLLALAPDTVTGFEHGASDARFLARYGIPGIVWGANGDNTQHSDDEHLNIDSAFELYRILEKLMVQAAQEMALS